MAEWFDDEDHRTRRSVLRMHAQLTAALAQNLKGNAAMSISDYEVLAISSRGTGRAVRARELRCELQ